MSRAPNANACPFDANSLLKKLKELKTAAPKPRHSHLRRTSWELVAVSVTAAAVWQTIHYCSPTVAIISSFTTFIAVIILQKLLVRVFQPRSALMELADGISGVAPPDVAVRAERMVKLRASATPPPTQEQELGKLDVNPSRRFAVDDPEMLEFLSVRGYAVVNLGISTSKLEQLRLRLWDFLEKHTHGWKRGEPDTWDNDGLDRIGSTFNGIVNGCGMGHSDFLWAARTEDAVKEVFQRIWGE